MQVRHSGCVGAASPAFPLENARCTVARRLLHARGIPRPWLAGGEMQPPPQRPHAATVVVAGGQGAPTRHAPAAIQAPGRTAAVCAPPIADELTCASRFFHSHMGRLRKLCCRARICMAEVRSEYPPRLPRAAPLKRVHGASLAAAQPRHVRARATASRCGAPMRRPRPACNAYYFCLAAAGGLKPCPGAPH